MVTPAVASGSSVASPVRSWGLRGSGAVAPSAPDHLLRGAGTGTLPHGFVSPASLVVRGPTFRVTADREAGDVPATTTDRPRRPLEAAPPHSHRWHSLDVLKGLALWAMIAHHFNKWAGGPVDGRFVGFDHFLVTDLAAPVFAVALGAAAVVVGSRARAGGGLRGPVRRWGEILALGLVIDWATHHLAIEGRGVLPTLAVLGLVVTLAVAAGLRHPLAWWAVTVACLLLAAPATAVRGDGVLVLLLSGPFSLPVYGVFAAAGAAVACHGMGRAEDELPLWRAAAGVLVAGLAIYAVAGGAVAPEGIWPPSRYPGHLGFTLWGLVASLAVWGLTRRLLPPGRMLSEAAARVGHRTLLVFGAHFIVKLALQRVDLIGELDTRAWGYAIWAAVVAVGALAALPTPRSTSDPHRITTINVSDGNGDDGEVPVVRPSLPALGGSRSSPSVLHPGLPPEGLHQPAAGPGGRAQRG